MKLCNRLTFALSGILLCAATPLAAQTTAFVGGRIVDGTGKVIERGTVIVRDGKIVQVGPAASVTVPQGAERVDLNGLTLMPGLINAHGHISDVVGLQSDKQLGNTRENVLRQARAYAHYGVTTVFSLGGEPEATFAVRNEQSSGPLDRSRLFIAGPIIGADTAEAARAATDKTAALKPDLIKIRVDDNLGSSKKMAEEGWRATIRRANELELPLAAHIYYLADAKDVLSAGSRVIAHSVRDVPVDNEFVQMMKTRNACYSPTLMREGSTYIYGSTPEWVNDPFFLSGLGADADAIKKQLMDPQGQAQTQ